MGRGASQGEYKRFVQRPTYIALDIFLSTTGMGIEFVFLSHSNPLNVAILDLFHPVNWLDLTQQLTPHRKIFLGFLGVITILGLTKVDVVSTRVETNS